ncbi:MAG: hypothetical protein ACPIOQ_14020 [Promethearchaeia archaeon]
MFGKTTDSAPSILPANKRIRRKRPAAPLIQRLRSSGELAGFHSWAQLQSRGRRQRPRPQPEEEAGQSLSALQPSEGWLQQQAARARRSCTSDSQHGGLGLCSCLRERAQTKLAKMAA